MQTHSPPLFPMLHGPSPSKQSGSISPAEKAGACGPGPGSSPFPRPPGPGASALVPGPSPSDLSEPCGAAATAWRGVWAAGRAAKAGPGERRAAFGALISARPENGSSEPRQHDVPPGMGMGHGVTRRDAFSVLVVADAKCQQAWGQHPAYKVSARLIAV